LDSVLLTDYPLEYQAWIRELGYAVPEEMGIALLSRSGETDGIAGIDEQMELLGEATARIVISLLRHNERGLPRFPRYTLVEGSWIDRPTVRAVVTAGTAS
jgi:LacI family transcriptional regulator